MMTIIYILYIVMLIFGILQIILFFKVWGMTDDVKELKNLYADRSKELSSSIDKLAYAIKNSNQLKGESQKSKQQPPITATKVEERIQEKVAQVEKELPIIDENSDEFKQRLRKWKILNSKGYTEQAVNEYMEYTGRSREYAVKFMKTI